MTEDTTGNLGFQAARWYVCATCQHCGLDIPLVEVGPRSPVSSAGQVSFHNLPCPHCHGTDDYSIEWLLERLQANLRAPSSAGLH